MENPKQILDKIFKGKEIEKAKTWTNRSGDLEAIIWFKEKKPLKS